MYKRIDHKIGMNNPQFQKNSLSDAEKREVREFLMGEPISKVQSGVILWTFTASTRKAALQWAEDHGEKIVYREDIGSIVFNKTGLKNSLAHGMYPKKIDTIPAISAVIEKGKIIDVSNDFDGRAITNILLAAPIQIDDEKAILLIRIRKHKGAENKFYIHDVYTIDDIKNMSDTFKPGGSDKSVGLSRSIAHIKSVLRDIYLVNSLIF
jgi:hypothetical protein